MVLGKRAEMPEKRVYQKRESVAPVVFVLGLKRLVRRKNYLVRRKNYVVRRKN